MAHPGHVIFIGAGPGSADLITLRGAAALARAEVVLHDALTDPALHELAPHAEWIDVGKRGFSTATAQTRINALLVQHAQGGALVARLKGGDPSVFGRLEEEIHALAEAGLTFEVVPGVTAALAAAAASARPLTRRGNGRSVSLTTAMTQDRELHAGRRADTEVFYMAGRQLAMLSRRLVESGWPVNTPVCVVSRAGWPDQLISQHDVASLPAACVLHAGRPSVVTVGVGATEVAPVTAAAHGGTAEDITAHRLVEGHPTD
ncbi:uroporphyrinogen-III C-methyltransferase [Ideonella sp. DXS29W]|uniref:uroporphyrinogen-III C-methyltransferase n=1 Tax=Ideonella lacteola TaxID=2984193 RepID=A0ABU9BUZ7_9BURK